MTEQLTQTLAINVRETGNTFIFNGGTFRLGEGPFTEQTFTAFDDDTDFSSLSTQPEESQGATRQTGQLQDVDGNIIANGQSSLSQVITLTDPATGETILAGRVRLTADDGSFGDGALLGEFYIFSGPIDPAVTYNVKPIDFAPGDSGGTSYEYSLFQAGGLANQGAVCFAAGTLIATDTGLRPVEALRAGDLVQTLDAGLQPILWCGQYHVPPAVMRAFDRLRPVIIAPDPVIGNETALIVSQQHRIAVNDVFVKAKHLPDVPGMPARIARGMKEIRYHHVLLEDHHLLLANGVPAESLFLGPVAQKIVSTTLLHLPDFKKLRHNQTLCRPVVKFKDIKRLRVPGRRKAVPLRTMLRGQDHGLVRLR